MSVTVLIKHPAHVFGAYLIILHHFPVRSITGKGGSKGIVICWQSQDQNSNSPMPVFPEPEQTAVAHRAAKEMTRQEKRAPLFLVILRLTCLTNLFVFHIVP